MEGVVELAEEIFHMPVSLGHPKHITGLKDIVRNPVYATGVGLLLYGQSKEEETNYRGRGNSNGIWSRIRQWMTDNF